MSQIQNNPINSGIEEQFRKSQGSLLKKARKNTNYSQEQVGALFGVSQDTISKIENGKQTVNSYHLLEFAKLYNKPVSFFYMVNTTDLRSSKQE